MVAPEPGTASTRRGRLGPDFVKLWLAQGISNLGDGVYLTALPLLAATLARDPLPVSAVMFAEWLPWLLFTLLAGPTRDTGRAPCSTYTTRWDATLRAARAANGVQNPCRNQRRTTRGGRGLQPPTRWTATGCLRLHRPVGCIAAVRWRDVMVTERRQAVIIKESVSLDVN
jgi:hypothetical protein